MNNNLKEILNEELYIDGELFLPKIIDKEKIPTFKEKHVRVTTYVEKNLHIIIQLLLEGGQIDSITQLVNDSLKFYLMEKVHAPQDEN